MADAKISTLTAIGSVADTDLFEVAEDAGGGNFDSRKATAAQVATNVLASTDAKGRWVEISRATASSSATIDFTGISSTYDCYMVEFYNVVPATDGDSLALRTSTDGGSSYDSGASNYKRGSALSAYFELTGGIGNDTSENGASGYVMIFRPSQAARCQFLVYSANMNEAGSMFTLYEGGYRVADADVDAIRFLCPSGNISSGVFVLLGRKK